jgi:hypothetical protein
MSGAHTHHDVNATIDRLGETLVSFGVRQEALLEQTDVVCAALAALLSEHPNRDVIESRSKQRLDELRLARLGEKSSAPLTDHARLMWLTLFPPPQ